MAAQRRGWGQTATTDESALAYPAPFGLRDW